MKLFYRKSGSGPPMIILHGLYGASDNWMTIGKKLSEKYTLIIPDMRNHGLSPHSQVNTYEDMAMDIKELAEELHLGKFFLAGHSMGGRAAVRFALNWPEKLYSLIVIDITPFATRDPEDKVLRLHREILDCILNSGVERLKSRKEVEVILAERIRPEKIRGLLMKNLKRKEDGTFNWKLNAKALLENIQYIMDGACNISNDCEPVSGFPVLFIRGSESDYILDSDIPKIKSVFPQASVHTVKGAGHWVQADMPDEISDLLLSQLEN